MRILILFVVAFLVACNPVLIAPERAAYDESELKYLETFFSEAIFADYDKRSNNPAKRDYRNKVVGARVRAIDIQYARFSKELFQRSAEINLRSDGTTLALGAAGAVSTVSSSQAIISALSGFNTGMKTSIDKNVLFESTASVIFQQMEANRAAALVPIYQGYSLGVEDYPLMRALLDVEAYYRAGTIMAAVSSISRTSGEQQAESKDELQQISKNSYLKDNASQILRKYWKPDEITKDTDNENKIKNWMKENGVKESITTFLYSAEYKEQRLEAVRDLLD